MIKTQVVHAVIVKEGQMLLGKRNVLKENDPGHWASTGGRLERHDTRLVTGKWTPVTFDEDSIIKLSINESNDLHIASAYREKYSGVNESKDIIFNRKRE